MPHIRAIFPENPTVRDFLRRHRDMICITVSKVTGYDKSLIAFVPEPISTENMKLASNVLPLELVVEAGVKIADHDTAEKMAAHIKEMILEYCSPSIEINFGVWLRAYHVNGYTEHRP